MTDLEAKSNYGLSLKKNSYFADLLDLVKCAHSIKIVCQIVLVKAIVRILTPYPRRGGVITPPLRKI